MSEGATKDLVGLLVKRGYFHDGLETPLSEVPHEESVEAMKGAREKACDTYAETDQACLMISTSSECYLTRAQLQTDLLKEVRASGGRLPFGDAAIALAVDKPRVERVAPSIGVETTIQVFEQQLITREYLDEVTTSTVTQLSLAEPLRVSHLADAASLPSDVMGRLLSERIELKEIEGKLVTLEGVKELVPPAFQELVQTRVRGTLTSLTMPSSVESLCAEFGWDASFILPIIRDLCKISKIPGELHESSSSSSGAMYVPQFYQALQRKSVDDFYSLNGFITTETCLSMGITATRMRDYVKESFPDAVALPGSVINEDVVVTPLETAIGESISSMSFVDLNLHLPVDYSHSSDIKEIVNTIVLPKLKHPGSNPGVFVGIDGEALYFSGGMIEDIKQRLLPPLVEAYGKTRAGELRRLADEETIKPVSKRSTAIESEELTGGRSRGKMKSRRRKGDYVKKGKEVSKDSDFGVVSLCLVAREVSARYPDLADIQETHGPLFEGTEEGAPNWSASLELEDDSTDGPLYKFCRVALFTTQLQRSCSRAVRAELERLKAIKEAVSLRSRKDGAAKIRSIEHAFEDSACFPAACHMVQMLAKFIDYVSSLDVDNELVSDLKADFLRQCGADFVRRITEYCLFKNDVEEGVFAFLQTTPASASEKKDKTLPAFCQPVEASVLSFPGTFLSCSHGEDAANLDPLPLIRKLLPGNVGVSLARMWSHCGGECYEGGTKVSEDGKTYTRPGDYEEFLKCAKESCLTICGLPFKQLDKKSEKQAMFSRRQGLTRRLQEASEAYEILDITVMLLFQQVKGLAVCGRHVRGSILVLLSQEKKLPDSVSSLIIKLADCLRCNTTVEAKLLDAVKDCGLSKDISKQQV